MTDTLTAQLATLDAETLARELDWATAANGIRTLRDLGEPAAADALALLAGQCEAYARTAERAHNRLAALEARHERIWDIVLELRQKATARGLDPYQDPAAQALSAILTGDTGWQITYGTLVETRDDLEAAKARAVDLWERTKWEAEEHAHDWEQRPDGSLALVGWDEEQWFDCGPVIRPLIGDESEPVPQVEGQTVIPAPGTGAAR